jgi:hypothetical protein
MYLVTRAHQEIRPKADLALRKRHWYQNWYGAASGVSKICIHYKGSQPGR